MRLDPELRVDVIAHSAGGLVARYYVRYGGRDVLDAEAPPPLDPGGHGIDRLVLIGTPNFGSIAAVQQAMFGKRFPLGLAGPEVLATLPRPSRALSPSPARLDDRSRWASRGDRSLRDRDLARQSRRDLRARSEAAASPSPSRRRRGRSLPGRGRSELRAVPPARRAISARSGDPARANGSRLLRLRQRLHRHAGTLPGRAGGGRAGAAQPPGGDSSSAAGYRLRGPDARAGRRQRDEELTARHACRWSTAVPARRSSR